jgi:hypothetical protein
VSRAAPEGAVARGGTNCIDKKPDSVAVAFPRAVVATLGRIPPTRRHERRFSVGHVALTPDAAVKATRPRGGTSMWCLYGGEDHKGAN